MNFIWRGLCRARAACVLAVAVPISLFSSIGVAQSQPKQTKSVVAVFDIVTDGIVLPDTVLKRLNKFVGVNLVRTGKFEVIPDEELKRAMVRLKIESQADCYADVCKLQLGGEVAANSSLTVEILKSGDRCSIIANMFDLRKATSAEGDVVDNLECKEASLIGGISLLATRLADQTSGTFDDSVGPSAEGFAITSTSSREKVDYGEAVVNAPTDHKGLMLITSVPDKAIITVDTQRLGPAPRQQEFSVGKHVVVAELDEYYHALRQEVVLGEEAKNVEMRLAPAFGAVEISGTPSGAEVYVNGKLAGTTPFSDPKFKSGFYHLEVRKALYSTVKDSIVVQDGKTTSRVINLSPEFGHLHVDSEPRGATVWFDGKEKGQTPLDLRDIPAGTYDLRVSKDYYAPVIESVVIGDGKTVARNPKLASDSGEIQVATSPPGAVAWLDSDPLRSCTTPCLIAPVTPGLHTVSASLNGHGNAAAEVTVANGKRSPVELTLMPKVGRLKVMSEYLDGTPCRGTLYIDGTAQSSPTPWVGNVLATRHSLEVRCEGGNRTDSVDMEHNGSITRVLKICKPNCAGRTCGSDGCGGECGQCRYGSSCQSGSCVSGRGAASAGRSGQSDIFVDVRGPNGMTCRGEVFLDGTRLATSAPYKGSVDPGFHYFRGICPDGSEGTVSVRVNSGEPAVVIIRTERAGSGTSVSRNGVERRSERPAPERDVSRPTGNKNGDVEQEKKPPAAALLLETDFLGYTYYFKSIDSMGLTLGPIDVGGRFWNRLRLMAYFDVTVLFNSDAPSEAESGSGRAALGLGGKLGVEIVRMARFGLSVDGKLGFEYNASRCSSWDSSKECTDYDDVSPAFVTGANVRFKIGKMFQLSANVDWSTTNGPSLGARVGMFWY